MEWLWTIQLVINLLVVVSLLAWWRERKNVSADGGAKLKIVRECETQAQQLERDIAVYRKRSEDQLRFLVKLCEQAHGILMRHSQSASVGLSMEEQELKALQQTSPPEAGRAIPSVQELESKKRAMRPEIPMDLRSLLRDQLT